MRDVSRNQRVQNVMAGFRSLTVSPWLLRCSANPEVRLGLYLLWLVLNIGSRQGYFTIPPQIRMAKGKTMQMQAFWRPCGEQEYA